jgi:flagellar motor component MotA
MLDGTDCEFIRDVMTVKIEREHDYYRKKLMEVAREGVLYIQSGYSRMQIVFRLASLVDIKNNPLDAACAKYLSGDAEAFDNIDLSAAIQGEGEREEVRFIKRAMSLVETARKEGLASLDKRLDFDGIAAKDILEYGLPLIIDNWDYEEVNKILTSLISHETNPVRENIALAKREALKMIHEGLNPQLLLTALCAYFDDSVTKDLLLHLNDD